MGFTKNRKGQTKEFPDLNEGSNLVSLGCHGQSLCGCWHLLTCASLARRKCDTGWQGEAVVQESTEGWVGG